MSYAATFKGGPADGQTLSFGRLPVYLRVVHDPTDFALVRWDVLDQLEDEPTPGETISVYKLVGEPSAPIFACRGPGAGSFSTVEYAHLPEIDGEDVRSTVAWRNMVNEMAEQEDAHA